MTKFWIVVNNTHEGPYTMEQLVEMNVSPDTYAWYNGLPRWTLIRDIPELASIVEAYNAPEKDSDEEIPEISDSANAESNDSDNVGAVQTASRMTPPEAPLKATPPPPPERPVVSTPEVEPVTQTCVESDSNTETKCPPTYLAWSIITTILFFLPVGIAAIIYSAKVKNLWYTGETERAFAASETAAWLSNIAFVIGLMQFPFLFAMGIITA